MKDAAYVLISDCIGRFTHGLDLLIQLSVIVEFMAGKITETIERLIALYRPDSLIVGSRGPRSTLKTWGAALGAPGMGSVSRYGNPPNSRKTFLI